VRLVVGLFVACFLAAAPSAGQTAPSCPFLCAPQLLLEPTLTVENLAKAARVRTSTGLEETLRRERVFELILAVDIPTRLPRLGFTAETIFSPFASDNAVEVEFEVNFELVRSEQTKGWVSSHVDVVDKFSPAERPADRSSYTHKLNFEWDTAVALFSRLPTGRWVRDVELEGSLDFVATGLPKAGDLVDGETFVTPASPWSFSLVLVIPLTRK
jgi:hypothetical protein